MCNQDFPLGNHLTKIICLPILKSFIYSCIFISFFLQSKTITITNSDTANEVISISLPMLGITVSDPARYS